MAGEIDRDELRFLLDEWLRIGDLPERPRYAGQSTEMYEDILELTATIAAERFAPHNRVVDVEEPYVVDGSVRLPAATGDALAALIDAGLLGTSLDESLGGAQLPFVLSLGASACFHAANAATYAYAMLTAAAANLLAEHADPEQAGRWVPAMADGRFFGTMCLSEPQAGSSLADITTRAVRQPDGTYRIFGTKMWISGGEHELAENIVHLVLARTPDAPPGVKGISLFLVPRRLLAEDGSTAERNDVTLAGLNHKLGYRGTVNTVLGFGEGVHRPGGEAGAVGELIGSENQGLAYMFHMMNEARIGVGTCATGLGYAGYRKSLRYAEERPQGRPLSKRGTASGPVPIIEHPDVRRMLLAQKSYVEGALALVLYCGRLTDDAKTLEDPDAAARAHSMLEVLTPIAKSWPSQWCLAANDLAIQIHGGYGYSRDYDVEQHYRDNRLNAIHEGTHGIQALDLLGRKVGMDGGAAFSALLEEIRRTIARAADSDPLSASLAKPLEDAVSSLEQLTARLAADEDRDRVLAHATAYMEAMGHIVVAWLWLDVLLALGPDRDDDFALGKRQAARFFFLHELPRVHPQLELIASGDRIVLDTDPAWL